MHIRLKNKHTQYEASQRGVTLIEVAVAMIIIGLIVAPLASYYTRYIEKVNVETTYNNVSNVSDFLQEYKSINGAFPCPAPMNVGRDTPEYGSASNCRAGAIAALNFGDCASGICVEETVRASLVGNNRRVIVGAIPFRDMQLPEEFSLDGYGQRLLYAISYGLTDDTNFDPDTGAISVVGENAGENMSSEAGNVPFVIISFGKTGRGAYSKSGALVNACPAAGASLDRENCNDGFEDGSGPNQSIYLSSFKSSVDGVGFYDDYMSYIAEVPDELWRRIPGGTFEDVESLTVGNVGVGKALSEDPVAPIDIGSGYDDVATTFTNDSVSVHGAGSLGGRVITETVCDEDGANCFEPELLTGNSDDLKCPNTGPKGTGKFFVGIEGKFAVCSDVAIRCPASAPVLEGKNPDGTLKCGGIPLASCSGEAKFSICGPNDFVINVPAATPKGSDWGGELRSFGDCRNARVKCDDGNFYISGQNGHCSDYTTGTSSCGWGYTGTKITTACSNNSNNCECVGGTRETTHSCGWNKVGTYTKTCVRTPQADPTKSCIETCTNDKDDVCECKSQSPSPAGYECSDGSGDTCRLVKNGNCPARHTGEKKREIKWTESCKWQNTGYYINTCTCDDTYVETSTGTPVCGNPACEVPDTNNEFERTIVDTATCKLGPKTLVTAGTCKPKVLKWRLKKTGPTFSVPNASDTRVGDSCSCGELGTQTTCYPLGPGLQRNNSCICSE